MRHILKATAVAATLMSALTASAQYYQIANQIPQLISPALSGSANYKGYVEASYLKGVGSQNADFAEIATSQGYKFTDWFYMGVGAGVTVMFTHSNDGVNPSDFWNAGYNPSKSTSSTGVLIPLFTDFRFNFGNSSKASFYADVRLGCSFLVNNSYIRINNGYLTSSQNFYLRPSIGVRIPTNPEKPKQAVNVGLTYQLITSNYWYNYSSNVCLNAIGLNVAYEW